MPLTQTASLQISDTQTSGPRAVKRTREIQYQQLICHVSRLFTPGEAEMTEAA